MATRLFDRIRAAKRLIFPGQGGSESETSIASEAQATVWVDKGNQLTDEGRHEEAAKCYQQALVLAPNLARAHLNPGNLLLATGDPLAALQRYSVALALSPGYAAAHYNMGNANARLRRTQAALECYRQALALQPDFIDAEVALGNTLDDFRLYEQAAESYLRALRLKPDYAQVRGNLANTLRSLGRLESAAENCRLALELDPPLAEAHQMLGLVLLDQGHKQQALEEFRRAMAAQRDTGAALSSAFHCANQLCDWRHRNADTEALCDMISRGVPGIAPFDMLSMEPRSGDAALLQRQAALRYAEHTLAGYLDAPAILQHSRQVDDGRLRIAYLSADFHEHATMHLLRGVLAAHDRLKYAIHGYSYGPTVDAVTDRAKACCDVFRDLASTADARAAAIMADDGIDILVDLKGFTKNTRMALSAQRPAPVTVSWLGYPGTLGHPVLADYIVGDAIVTPPEHAAHFSETLALMPHCYQPNDRQRIIGAKPSQAGSRRGCRSRDLFFAVSIRITSSIPVVLMFGAAC
jgi:predicted O-linked N-acetylglucosamine transferase (SPINDLY family)